MLKIGTLKLKHPFILAPMAGISDLSYRLLNHEFGCELAFVEMINARSLGYKSKKTRQMLATHALDKPFGVQILAAEPEYLERGLDILEGYKFDILDFNAACPAKKVVTRGEGAGLLKNPKKLQKLLKIVVKTFKLPVTVKIRSGWDAQTINARDVALFAQDAGIAGLFIHGRTKLQEYSGSVDYKVISEVKKALNIPVIASGDVFSGPLAKKMFDETGCDGVLVARGALGNPWIFAELKQYLKKGTQLKRPEIKEIYETMIKHLELLIKYDNAKMAVILFRKFFAWYTKGFRNVRHLREQACHAKTRADMLAVIEEFYACSSKAPLISA